MIEVNDSMIKYIQVILIQLIFITGLFAQPVPAQDENIPHLVTFGNEAETSWGDDDFCQVFFFLIPTEFEDPVYIKVFDPDCGGEVDEINGIFNTTTEFSIYGGATCWTEDDARGTEPIGNYKSGNLLASRKFGVDPEYDEGWYVFGPFNPKEGEFSKDFQGYVFKLIAEGLNGDDGNLYQYYLSTDADFNVPIEGGKAFTYEYTFRMWNTSENVSHIYPYVEEGTVSVRQWNFDWDNDGGIHALSVVRIFKGNKVSAEDVWADSEFSINPAEIGKSLDFRFVKKQYPAVINNNVVISVQNQFGEAMPFFNIPIGGVPKYQPMITIEEEKEE